MYVRLVDQLRLTLCDPMDCSPLGSSGPWRFSRQEYWMSCHAFLQGIFPTQGSNTGLPRCRWFLYQLSHKGSPRILECIAYSISSGSPWPRNWTGVSCIAGGFFTNWAKREDMNQSVNQSWGLDNCFMAIILLIYTSRVTLLIPPPPHTSFAQLEWIWSILFYFFLPLLCSV